MARSKRRSRKARVRVLFKSKRLNKLLRSVEMKSGESTGRHQEKYDYVVIPLTDGTMHVEIFESALSEKPTKVEDLKLKALRPYLRKVGRGIYINVTNTGKGKLHIFKD